MLIFSPEYTQPIAQKPANPLFESSAPQIGQTQFIINQASSQKHFQSNQTDFKINEIRTPGGAIYQAPMQQEYFIRSNNDNRIEAASALLR